MPYLLKKSNKWNIYKEVLLSYHESTKMGNIRISAAGLARIELDGKILFGLNKNKLQTGKKVYMLFGGALEFYEAARPFLKSLGAKFEEGNDLRFMIPEEKISKFEKWFYQKINREISPYRELKEELVDEEEVLPDLPKNAVNLEYLTTVSGREVTDRIGQEGKMTHRFLEIYRARFIPKYEAMLRNALKKPDTHLGLISERESQAGKTDLGIKIITPYLLFAENKDKSLSVTL